MRIRVMQIWGFLLTVLGWIFVACSMAMEGWKVTSIGGQGGSAIIRVAWYWSSLWRACFTDSSNTSNCYDFPVLWSVEGYLQIVRALLMSGMAVGMLGIILSLVGMECTYIGGKDKEKHRSVFIGGMLASSGYAVYAHYVSVEFFDPKFDGLHFDLGKPLFLGWSGCAFQITGGFFFLVSVCKTWSPVNSSAPVPAEEGKALHSSHTNISIVSELSSKSKESTISELSSKSELSAVSNVPSKNRHIIRTGRSSRFRPSEKSRSSVKSEVSQSLRSSWSSRLSRSDVNSRKVSSGVTTHHFSKNSYL
ncbi:claudin-10-like isoform X2 [Xyrauchen texanus]|uniref:claudin-10-like isoform X2 n=1 Tax=Xyrauchen texanus TaxID=154827 RepID=UPI002242A5F3|nr:claudin-10-like isoform X2 [Xyrauchen texanus]